MQQVVHCYVAAARPPFNAALGRVGCRIEVASRWN